MAHKIEIRSAQAQDVDALLAIYAPYVEQTAITFEYQVPSREEFLRRMQHTLEFFPFLVAQVDGCVLGYAYAGSFKDRPAYQWAVETSIYVQMDCRRMGIGRALYAALEPALAEQGILNVNACIAYPPQPDPYLTQDSVLFHRRLGYEVIGEFHQCGFKFDRWYNMVWMEKHIGPHSSSPAIPKPFSATDRNGFL